MVTGAPDYAGVVGQVFRPDRIIPLSAGPRATLGPSIVIDLPRPRDRRELNHHPRFREIRREAIHFMLESRAATRIAVTPALSVA